MSIIREFTLYLHAGITTPEVIHANQYSQGETWIFKLLQDDSSVYVPSTGALIGVKADGHAIAGLTGTVLGDGRVSITTTQQLTAAAGDASCELTIDGGTNGSANFVIRVEKKPTDDAILSESDLSIIQQGLNSVTPAAINESVSNYLEENLTDPPIDPSLSISNAAADAKVTGDKITELKTAIQYKNELKDGYITYNNGTVHTSTSRKYTEFPVSYGMSVYYSFNDGAAYNMGLAFYNEAGSYISGAIAQNTPQIVEVPENAVFCKATARNEDDSLPINYNNAIQINRTNTKKALTLNIDAFEYLENKYAYYSTKNIADYTGINVIVFPVFEGMKFTYSMINSNPNAVGLHFRNATGGYVSGIQAVANPVDVTVPATATICYASVYNKSQITFNDLGNALLDNAVNTSENVAGIETTTEPLENITDITGMLDIFLNVGCIGDSLASGESYWNDGGTNKGSDFYQYSWGQYLARKTGNKYYNWSKGGLSTKLWLQSEYATECFDGQHLCEAYIIGLGQNDANYNYTIGTSADIDLTNYNNNADTFYGSYGKIIQRIKEVQPQAKIFVITDPNTSTDTMGYNTAIRAMATIFTNVYVIDMRTYALKYMQSSVLIAQLRAGHFNAYGYKVFAMMIANYIDWIVTTNYTEFTQVELIGTGHTWTS